MSRGARYPTVALHDGREFDTVAKTDELDATPGSSSDGYPLAAGFGGDTSLTFPDTLLIMFGSIPEAWHLHLTYLDGSTVELKLYEAGQGWVRGIEVLPNDKLGPMRIYNLGLVKWYEIEAI